MSAPITEGFTGGVVTARMPAQLKPDELQRADDCVYRNNDDAIWRAPGRTNLTAAIGTTIYGMHVFPADPAFTDQLVLLGRRTAGSPTWASGIDTTQPDNHLYSTDWTAANLPSPIGSGIAPTPTEIGGTRRLTGDFQSTSLNSQVSVASCVIPAGGLVITTANSIDNVHVGAVVSGTGVTAGTRVLTIDLNPASGTRQFTLDTVASAGTVTLTFTEYPFLAASVGASILGVSPYNLTITAVSNQDGTTGHYRTATLSAAATSNGVVDYVCSFGASYGFNNTGNESLSVLPYGNKKYFVWQGTGPLSIAEWKTTSTISPILSCRPVGLKPIENVTSMTMATTSGSWNASSSRGNGTYWFLITEMFCPVNNVDDAMKDPILKQQIIESSYLGINPSASATNLGKGLPIPVTISDATTQGVLITLPAVTNDGTDNYVATHWAVYVYGPVADMPSLASMRRCATARITQFTAGATIKLTESSVSQIINVASVATISPFPAFSGGGALLIGAFDNKMCGSRTSVSHRTALPVAAANALTFTAAAVNGVYTGLVPSGVEVTVRGQANSRAEGPNAHFRWRLYITGNARSTETINGDFGSNGAENKTWGSAYDTLGVAWTLNDTTIMNVDIAQNPAVYEELDLDSVQLRIYYNGQNVKFDGPAYRVVTYLDQVGASISDPARLLPPTCSTGDYFNGYLVVNNLAIPSQLRWSLPNECEAFPRPYQMTFSTTKKANVTFIKAFGTILFVGLEHGLKRVNYLPTEQDTNPQSGLTQEDIASDAGIPGPQCAVVFDMPGEGTLIAFMSQIGPYLTNGIWTRPLCSDLNWANLVKVSALSTAVLKVYSKEKWLAFYYCPSGATHNKNTRVIYFCYQPDKLKQGPLGLEMPAVGPAVVAARTATVGWLANQGWLLTANEGDGKVYVEDNGLTVPSGYRARLSDDSGEGDGKTTISTDVTINPLIRTRKVFAAGVEEEIHAENLYVLYSAYGSRSTTATADATAGSATVSAATAVFAASMAGNYITGTGIDGGTIVLSVAGDNKSIVISRVANTDAASGTVFTFDTGTLAVTIRGSGFNEAVLGLQTVYGTTTLGDLMSLRAPELRSGFELQFEKVPLTFDSNHDTATNVDLHVNMRLHQFTYVTLSAGREMNRLT
jgi:hypothetical protein